MNTISQICCKFEIFIFLNVYLSINFIISKKREYIIICEIEKRTLSRKIKVKIWFKSCGETARAGGFRARALKICVLESLIYLHSIHYHHHLKFVFIFIRFIFFIIFICINVFAIQFSQFDELKFRDRKFSYFCIRDGHKKKGK